MILVFLVFFLNIFGSNTLDMYVNGDKQFATHFGNNEHKRIVLDIPQDSEVIVKQSGNEIFNNAEFTKENTLLIYKNDQELFRKTVFTAPLWSQNVWDRLNTDKWIYALYLKKQNDSFSCSDTNNLKHLENPQIENYQIYRFKVINNGNGKILYDTTLELSPTDFIKWVVQPIKTRNEKGQEIIVGAEIFAHKYIPEQKKEKKEKKSIKNWSATDTVFIVLIGMMFVTILSMPYFLLKKG